MPCLPSWWRIPRGWGQWPPGSPRQRTNDLITGHECDMKNTAIVLPLIYGDFRARRRSRLNIKTAFPGYRYSFYKDESVVRPSNLYNGPGDHLGPTGPRSAPCWPMNLAIWGNPYSFKQHLYIETSPSCFEHGKEVQWNVITYLCPRFLVQKPFICA